MHLARDDNRGGGGFLCILENSQSARIARAGHQKLYGIYIASAAPLVSILYAFGAGLALKECATMLDVLMVIFGVVMFGCFFGYTAVCDKI